MMSDFASRRGTEHALGWQQSIRQYSPLAFNNAGPGGSGKLNDSEKKQGSLIHERNRY